MALHANGERTGARDTQARAVELLRRYKGDSHPDTLQARENLAITDSLLGAAEQARVELREVYRARGTGRAALVTLNNLVVATRRAGRLPLALRLAQAAWAQWHRIAGASALGTLDALDNLGAVLLHAGFRVEAAQTFTHVAERREHLLTGDHPDTLDARENAAIAARAPFWPLYADRLRVQGPGHLDTLVTLRHLLLAQGPTEPVEPIERVVQPGARGPVAGVRLDGEHAELFAEVVAMAVGHESQQAVHGPASPEALRAKVLLCHALGAADQFDGQVEVALEVAIDSRDGLAEAAAREPGSVDVVDLAVAEAVHHWLLHLLGEEPTY